MSPAMQFSQMKNRVVPRSASRMLPATRLHFFEHQGNLSSCFER